MVFKKMAVIGLLCLPSLACSESHRFHFSTHRPDQGDVVIVSERDSLEPFSVTIGKTRYDSFLFRRHQTVLLGIDYQLPPGPHTVCAQFKIVTGTATFRYHLTVKERFPSLGYTIMSVPHPGRLPNVQDQIDHDQNVDRRSARLADLHITKMGPFSWPVYPVVITSPFGDRRCRTYYHHHWMNCQYHLGDDYRAAFDPAHHKPIPLHAIQSGRVVLAVHHELDGNVVFIDHGNGILSEYLHLSKMFVKKGMTVRSGQVIGIAGKTGEAAGIHLHFVIKMAHGSVLIDPQRFLKAMMK